MLTIDDLKDLRGKKVLVRVDFNVPHDPDGRIRDDTRIVAALPTIRKLVQEGAKVILLSHLGKVSHKGAPEEIEKAKSENSLAPAARRLSELLGEPVSFSPETRGGGFKYFVDTLKDGDVLLVQNTRYEKGETKNDQELAAEWASSADAYVTDAFASAHRPHASTYGVPALMKKEGKPVAVGYLVEKEIGALRRVVDVKEEDRPYVAILGGLKVSDKIKVISALIKKCDKILIGGAMAYTFAKALGHTIGTSPCEEDQLEYARRCIKEANGRIYLPLDSVCANAFKDWTEKITTSSSDIPAGFQGMDIGPKTIELFKSELEGARMVFWNGPLGVSEQRDFAGGTIAIAKAIASLPDCFSVIGGGDSAAAAAAYGLKGSFSHVSTGGGASLMMIETGGHLPGIDILE